ncbi:hypothetical protein RHIZ_22975 [Rhizobium skierniewicense]|uniref:WcbI family polysaccharide biosynthesis putative acetyltransferase n=1 Tax=Rhizobium skierniewicense TaxID=984260 RepID=UPI001FAD8429|nr:hypothetical protein [Rhizobium skierniewicense]
MKITLLGNCQVESIRACLGILLPSAQVSMHNSWNITNEFGSISKLKSYLQEADVVIAHRFYGIPGIEFEEIASHSRFLEFPVLNFSSFHPDCIYLVDADKNKIVRSVIGDYNSSIIAFSYQNSVSIAQCLASFREEIFKFVGYYDAWDSSVKSLDAEFARCGFRAGDYLARWMSKEPFVHSINHPKLFAIHDLVKDALQRLGIKYFQVNNITDYVADPLLNYSGWPIYDQIAEIYGYSGDFYFRGNYEHNARYLHTLPEFVETSYNLYAEAGVQRFSNELFDVWKQVGLLDRINS